MHKHIYAILDCKISKPDLLTKEKLCRPGKACADLRLRASLRYSLKHNKLKKLGYVLHEN